MVDVEPMPLEVLVGLVQLVRKGNGWPTKGTLVLLAGAQVGGGWFTSEDAAEASGKAPGTCRRLLNQLDNERVILRDPGVGGEAGEPRRYWVEVNPEWEQWRVGWRVPRRIVRQRVAALRQEARTTDLQRFIARSFDARYPEISARLWARDEARRAAYEAALSRDMGALSRVPWTRDNTGHIGARRAKSGGQGRSGPPSSRAHGRAITAADPQEERGTYFGDDEVATPVRGPAPPKRRSGVNVQRQHIHAAKRAVCAHAAAGRGTDKPVIFPRSALEERLIELVAEHGVDLVIAGCDKIEHGVYAPPMFVELLGDLLATGALPHDEGQALSTDVDNAPRPTREQLEDERRRIGRRIATYEAEGFPPPDELMAEQAKIDEALAKYTDHMGVHPEGATT